MEEKDCLQYLKEQIEQLDAEVVKYSEFEKNEATLSFILYHLDNLRKVYKELQDYRKVMCRPIQVLIKELQMAEMLKKRLQPYNIYYRDIYIVNCEKQEKEDIKEWLDGKD